MFESTSVMVCPKCGHRESETMHEDTVQYFYKCKGCAKIIKPIKGDCCVYCSYGDTPCPTAQMYTGRRENTAGTQSWFLI
jgi:hypothetical protein